MTRTKSPVIGEPPSVSEEGRVRNLQQRLTEAEATIQALLSGQIDAVVDATHGTPVLLAKAQEALKESEERFREQAALLDIANDAIYVRDLDGRITYWNKGAELAYGWTAGEALGRVAVELLGTEPTEFQAAETALLRNGGWQGEMGRRTQAGRVITMAVRWTLVRDAQGHPKSVLAINTDITAQKQAVETLRAAEERMRFALQNADVGIWDMDFATGVIRWSEILECQFGLRPGTFGGTFEAFVELVHPDDRAALVDVFAGARKSGADFSYFHRVIWPDGTRRWLSGAGRVLLGAHGKPVRGVGIYQDLTERHTLEAQFNQAQKMEALGRLAGGVAHDFNNLLTVILGFCELLLADRGADDPGWADIVEIQKAGTRAAGLTGQLLSFSRKQIIEPTRLDLNLVVADMQPMLARLIGEDVAIVLDLRPELAAVRADRGQLEQVVLNLAVNARDAMPKGGTLTIGTANVELDEHYATGHLGVIPGRYVALTISDTGTGMPPQVQARLFEPFFTTKEAGKGTGLGLSSVHGIVTRSGGNVEVASVEGRGTSFKVYWPRDAGAEMVVTEPSAVARPSHGAETVLVVEDADGLRALVGKVLQRQGYTVLVAANAVEAIQLFDQNSSIAVLLADVVMPGGSGPDLTTELIKRRPTLKVVYMSGFTDEAIVHHGVLEPGIIFLHKPFTAEALGAKIREALDR
ncbi:MAG TPA: PAS domain S-box protein [Vicinamibacterales bacterium]|nr:PAS domain S-box protein [Vicinamibacterales bacterium]